MIANFAATVSTHRQTCRHLSPIVSIERRHWQRVTATLQARSTRQGGISMLELTITQIAARLGVSERTAHRYLAAGKFHTEPGRKGRYLVDPDELDRLAASDPDEVAKLAAAVEALTRRVEVLESQAQPRPVRQRINIPGNIDQAQARVGEMVSARQF